MTTFSKRRAAGRAGTDTPPATPSGLASRDDRVRRTERPVPAWARWAAEIAAFAPVPSSLWRLPLIFGASMGMDADFMADLMSRPLWFRAAYLLGLGIVSDGAAFLTLGLVRWWGETWPRWVPFAGGRRVRPLAALVPALAGGVLMTCVAVAMASGWDSNVTHGYNGWEVLQTVMYAPLLVWGPLLLLVAGQYAWRRGPR